MKYLKLIICCDKDHGIGINSKLPWRLTNEMEIFRTKTIKNNNNCVIMGRTTYDSIPIKYRPLNKRENCIITTHNNEYFNEKKINLFHNLSSCINWIEKTNYDEYWVIGGKMIYEGFIKNYINKIDEVHLSKLNYSYNCDCFLNLDFLKNFNIIENTKYTDLDKNTQEYIQFSHIVFKKKMDYP